VKKKLLLSICMVGALLDLGALSVFAQNTSLQDLAFNANSVVIDYNSDPTFASDASSLGINLASYSYNSGTGLGTITYTTTAAGTGYFAAAFLLPVSVPSFNEYGTQHGTAASGVSWEIGDGDDPSSTFSSDFSSSALTDANDLPSGSDDYLGECEGEVGCNGDVLIGLGDSFILGANEEETITINVSQTAPSGGFYLDQTHPVDPNNPTQQDVYFTISAVETPTGNNPPPPVIPEPSTWLLMLTGMGAAAGQLRRKMMGKASGKLLSALALAVTGLTLAPFASAQSVLTVPWDPTNPAAPHTTYPLPIGAPSVSIPATSEATIVLGAVLVAPGSTDSFTYTWAFGDGSPVVGPNAVTNMNDISTTHQYPASAAVGTTWTAVVTVTDTTKNKTYTGNYLVIQEANTLQPRVNVAIDWGLWYLHQTMYHPSAGVGYWSAGCASGYAGYACGNGYGSLDATNVQAMEVNGHYANGPATDPYTSDVSEGLNEMFTHLTAVQNSSLDTYYSYYYLGTAAGATKTYTYNPAVTNFGCSDGSQPTTTNSGAPSYYCTSPATPVYYNAGATSCLSPPCSFTFDGNSNGQSIFAWQASGAPTGWGYEAGMYMDALVASLSPNAVASTGGSGVAGQTYHNIVQDLADADAYAQWTGDTYDVENGYTRGYPYGALSGDGGGWWYYIQEGNDNSASQWAAIGLIGAKQGFGIPIPSIVTDANNMWVTASQDVSSPTPVSSNPYDSLTDDYGGFGYNGALTYSEAWGSWATTPSGMVQMAMDGIGRTANTAFGASKNAPDQRFNNAETYYADNFCNTTADGVFYAPRAYTYGLFSFTKSMLLHNPGGVLSPIQYLQTQTPGVFDNAQNPNPNSIDWYAALSAANNGNDPCDGVAQTLVERQYDPNNAAAGYGSSTPGYWYGDNYSGAQDPYETAWSLIMLQRTVFINCVNNLGGSGLASGASPARIDLTWSGIPNVTGYTVQRSTTSGGPYTTVGTTTTTAYSDRTGLTNGDTYYYVLQPFNGAGAVCQSNQAKITVPKKSAL